MALPFTLNNNNNKSLRQKKELWKHSNISPCQNINLQRKSLKKEKPKSFKIYYNKLYNN
jgi:hypothetical protein